jgi:3-keto-L-gulonate-6-phosphate decarboxylase
MQVGVSVLGGLLGGLLGRKAGLGSLTRGSAAISKATSAYKQHQDVSIADAKIADITAQIQTIQTELEAEIASISGAYDPAALALETVSIKPLKSDVKVDCVALLWMPCAGG